MSTDLTDFLVMQLAAAGIEVRGADSTAPDLMAFCFKGHDKKTPSLAIRKADGMFYCFGCGIKGPNWNALAQHIGGKHLRDQDLPDPFGLLNQHLNKYVARAAFKQQLPWNLEPWEKGSRYRGLSFGFLEKINTHRWYDYGANCPRILFPVVQQHKLMGWVARRTDSGKEMKYRNSPGMKATKILFPFDFVHREFAPRSIVLVEGPMDALRLCHFKIPALAIMGTNNWHRRKFFTLLNMGIKRVVICTDGDLAGLRCRYETLEPALRQFDLAHYKPPEGEDPGSMDRSCVMELKELL